MGLGTAEGAGTLVVVDDDAITRRVLSAWARGAGFDVVECRTGAEILALDVREMVCVCLDLGLEDVPGRDVLAHLHARDSDLPVIIVTADRDLETAISSMRQGAYDYVTKPMNEEKVLASFKRAADRRNLVWKVSRLEGQLRKNVLGTIIGESNAMRLLESQLQRVTSADVPVCIFGETGTGKELVARAIHERSSRVKGPFVAINCAALAESLLESELFGHERGAFTGAHAVHRGCFEQAGGGTLFLDELGEMNASVQVKLLRTLQERTVRRVGGSNDIKIDVRIVAATHRDLAARVKSGDFREDLFYRLAVFPVTLPPLRQRDGDVPLLFQHFMQSMTFQGRKSPSAISAEALAALSRHSWPGNIRELQNVVQRAMLSCDSDRIELQHLSPEIQALVLPVLPMPKPEAQSSMPPAEAPIIPLRDLETQAILRALKTTNGSVSATAKLLGIGRATLYRRLAELNIEVADGPLKQGSLASGGG